MPASISTLKKEKELIYKGYTQGSQNTVFYCFYRSVFMISSKAEIDQENEDGTSIIQAHTFSATLTPADATITACLYIYYDIYIINV